MDPLTLIVTALAAGAGAGVREAASTAVKDAYASLKAAVRNRLRGRPDGEVVLTRYEQAPDTWQAPLTAELAAAGADQDRDLVAAAQALLHLPDQADARAGKYTAEAHGAQGVQIGDLNRQDNVYHAPPGG